jgi:pimeloyl-ACP methyl ester carboxylesterase
VHHVFAFDWRRDLVESARRLDETLEALADARGDRATRFNIVGHSMGGLIARYYLRYGTAEPTPGMPVTWAGARRINSMVLVAVPNAGSIHSLEAMLYGNRVGLSYTTLAASVIARMPSVYQIIPPKGAPALLSADCKEIDADLHDVATWERFGWGPFGSTSIRRLSGMEDNRDRVGYDEFLAAVLGRARDFHRVLAAVPGTPCPVRVITIGGDCMPTLARCIVPEKKGAFPRFEPLNRHEADCMFEAGDGRVTRASVLGSHLPAPTTRNRDRATRKWCGPSSAAPITTASTRSRPSRACCCASSCARAPTFPPPTSPRPPAPDTFARTPVRPRSHCCPVPALRRIACRG